MTYLGALLLYRGQAVEIARTPAILSRLLMTRAASNSSDPFVRDTYWMGRILAESGLQSGDVFRLGTAYYLVTTVRPSGVVRELEFEAVKCNAQLIVTRPTGVTLPGDVVVTEYPVWSSDVYALGSAGDWQVQKSVGILPGDRVQVDGVDYVVDAISSTSAEGVVRILASVIGDGR